VLAIPLILLGWLLATLVAPRSTLLERVAWTLLFTLAVAPFLAFNLSVLRPAFLSGATLGGCAAVVLAGLAWPAWRRRAALLPERPDGAQLATLALALAAGIFTWLHHDDTEFWLSLGSYLQRGEAKCFYMQTMSFVPELNSQASPELVRSAYGIISTPGNAVFTAGWMPVTGPWTFHFIHAAFAAVAVLFGTLLLQRWTGRIWIGLVVSVVALLNPYTLWIEVLDRNFIAFALSPALLYAVEARKEHPVLHGWLLALTAGVGLRFLPIMFALPVALLYWQQRQRPRSWLLLAGVAAACFAFNLPHLDYHGFHSMGEASSLPGLAWTELVVASRTPFLPHPNAVYYLRFALDCLGWILAALLLYGAGCAARRHPLRCAVLALMVLSPLVVLAGQRDWIEYDKTRILFMSWWALLAFLGFALGELATREGWPRRAGLLLAALAAVGLADLGLAAVHGQADLTSQQRKPLYQSEAPAYTRLLRERFAAASPLPDYGRLFTKTEWQRKRAKSGTVAHSLVAPFVGQGAAPNPWLERWLEPDDLQLPEPLASAEAGWVDLRIDLERLVTEPDAAASLAEPGARPLVDFSDPDRLLDIHHMQAQVSWQPQPLGVTVLAQRPEIGVLNEVALDLNAFVSLGQDDIGFEQVNLVSFQVVPGRIEAGKASAMTALPWKEGASEVVIRIRDDARVIIRNWLVNTAESVPHRIDSWCIQLDDTGQPELRFHFGEPESYL